MDVMKEKIGRISIDIDTPSINKLLLTYINAKKWFKNVPIKVEISSSGAGFHIIIYKDVSVKENLMWRALLGDDPVRISYSLRRLLMTNDKDTVDILFVRKNGKDTREINIDEIFEKHNIIPDEVNENNFDEVYHELYHDLAKLIGNIYYLVIPFSNDIDDKVIDEIYHGEGIRINKVKSYENDVEFYLVVKKLGNRNFKDELDVIKRYIDFTEYWIKKEVIK